MICIMIVVIYITAQDRIDHEYRYVIWSGDKDKIHVSCWNMYKSKCVFVLKPEKIISKYMNQDEPMDYTDFSNGETRYDRVKHIFDSTGVKKK